MNIEQYGWKPRTPFSYILDTGHKANISSFEIDKTNTYYWNIYDLDGVEIGTNIIDLEQFIVDNRLFSIQYKRNLKLKDLGI